MVDEVIILGGHIQALGLARQSKSMGMKVVLCIDGSFSVARFSNSVSEVYVYDSLETLHSFIVSRTSDAKHILLFPTNDEAIQFLCDNYKELSERFYLGIPDPETVALFSDKRHTDDFSRANEIPSPRTWCLETLDDIKKYRDEFSFPVVLKPAVMYTFHDIFGKKAYKCDSFEDLMERSMFVASKFPINMVMVQEFLNGGPKNLYSYGCFAVNGVPMAWLIANRIRQNPYIFGNSTTFAKTCYVESIDKTAQKILSATKYTGLAEIEFMYDESNSEYKFLEINTRAWKWHTISENFGFGFLSEYIKYLNGVSEYKSVDYTEPCAWVEHLTDVVVSAKAIAKGLLSFKEVRESYKLNKVSAVFSRKDKYPAIMYLLMSPFLFFKRH